VPPPLEGRLPRDLYLERDINNPFITTSPRGHHHSCRFLRALATVIHIFLSQVEAYNFTSSYNPTFPPFYIKWITFTK